MTLCGAMMGVGAALIPFEDTNIQIYGFRFLFCALVAMATAAAVAAVGLLAKKLRFVCESVSLTLMLFSVFERAFPNWFEAGASGGLGPRFWIIFLIYCSLEFLYRSTYPDRFKCSGPLFASKVTSRLSVTELWDGFAGTPGAHDRYIRGDCKDITLLAPDKNDRRLTFVTDNGMRHVQDRFVDDIAPPKKMRFRWQILDAAPDQPFTAGRMDFEVHDHGAKRCVYIREQIKISTWRVALASWIDDASGRYHDKELRKLEARLSGPGPN